MNTTYDLSWNHSTFRAKGTLFMMTARAAWDTRHDGAEAYAGACTGFSSTCYSIAGTSAAQLRAIFHGEHTTPKKLLSVLLWSVTWLPLGTLCYLLMLPASNHVVKLIGYEEMTADQCDVRQSILRRWYKRNEATACCLLGLEKEPKVHTRGLLLVGLASVLPRRMHDTKQHRLNFAIKAAEEVEEDDPRQALRIYRAAAKLYDDETLRERYLIKAKDLAEQTDAHDQALKIS